jgi:hypothetical protein
MKVRLTSKLADTLDGVDVSGYDVGQVIDLPTLQAKLLIAENWAVPERRFGEPLPPAVEPRSAKRHDDGYERSEERAS